MTPRVEHPVVPYGPRYRVAWRLFMALVVILTAGKVLLDVTHDRSVKAHHAAEAARLEKALAMPLFIPDEFGAGLRAHKRTSGSWLKPELEARINEGRPFVTRPHRGGDGDEEADWVNPRSQLKWTLRFLQGRWHGYSGTDYVGWAQPPGQSALHGIIERARRVWLGRSGWIWFAVLAFTLATWRRPRYARPAANALLAVAVLQCFAAFADGVPSLRRLVDNEALGWGLAMLVPSLVVHALACVVPDPAQLGRCRTCEYELTGNVSGVCPECGTPVTATAVEANAQIAP